MEKSFGKWDVGKGRVGRSRLGLIIQAADSMVANHEVNLKLHYDKSLPKGRGLLQM